MAVNQDFVDALDDSITRLSIGQGVEDCLRAYPQFAPALRSLLETGLLVRHARYDDAEIAEAQERSSFRFERALQTEFPRTRRSFQRVAGLVASVLLVFGLFVGGTITLAQDSLPGDTLYGVKLFSEDLRLSLSQDDEPLENEFNQRRVDEIGRLVELRRAAETRFQGIVNDIAADTWRIGDLMINIPAETPDTRSVEVGDRVEARVLTTTQGEVVALEIRPLQPPASDRTPPPLTNTPTMTATPLSPTPTATPTRPALTGRPATGTTRPSTASDTVPPPTTLRPTMTLASASDNCVVMRPDRWVRYTVRIGDILSALAVETNSTVEELARVNCLKDTRLLVVGQRLYLPQMPFRRPSVTSTAAAPGSSTPSAIDSPPRDGGQSDGDKGDGDGNGNGDQGGDRPRNRTATPTPRD